MGSRAVLQDGNKAAITRADTRPSLQNLGEQKSMGLGFRVQGFRV